jgi:hypothetical protein
VNDELPKLILAKLREQVERAQHLLALVPPEQVDWQPDFPSLRLSQVLGHLLECLAGFCAALYAVNPARLTHFERLRERPVNHRCGVAEASGRMREYMEHIEQGFALLTNQDLSRRIPTVFAPQGEALLTILLGNLEHCINHKYQLFFYLKMLGVPVGTQDLYQFRGTAAQD